MATNNKTRRPQPARKTQPKGSEFKRNNDRLLAFWRVAGILIALSMVLALFASYGSGF